MIRSSFHLREIHFRSIYVEISSPLGPQSCAHSATKHLETHLNTRFILNNAYFLLTIVIVVASYCVAIVKYHMWLDPRTLLNADMEMATKKFVLVLQFLVSDFRQLNVGRNYTYMYLKEITFFFHVSS